jgi:hypothetical protein
MAQPVMARKTTSRTGDALTGKNKPALVTQIEGVITLGWQAGQEAD